MKIEIPKEPTNWKRLYCEAITTTSYPTYNGKDHKGRWDISGLALVKMMARLAEKEAKEGASDGR